MKVIGAMIVGACIFCTSAYGQQIKSGLAFLKLGAGADAVARGDAMTATAIGAQALFYNPAGMAEATESSLLVMHNENVIDVRNDILGGTMAMGDFSLGLGLQAATVAGIEVRDAATIDPLGTFTSIDGALTLGAAYKISDEVAVGMNVKALIEKIYINDAFGGALDLGGMYRPAGSNLAFGLALQNIGSMGVMNNEAIVLPTTLRGGGAYSGVFDDKKIYSYTGSLDVAKTFVDQDTHIRIGAQFAYESMFFVRTGYETGFDASGFSAGVGVKYHFLQFDYALSPYAQSYGLAHTFSLKFDL